MEERTNKIGPIPTMEHCSARKSREVLTPATTRTDLGDITLGATSQAQKDGRCAALLMRGPQSRHSRRDRE